MADVGDGLCLTLSTFFKKQVQIDCGGENCAKALQGLNSTFARFSDLNVFVLTHFHIDHYRGLLYYSNSPEPRRRFGISEVYYPRIPDFPEREEFFRALFTINLEVFGNETGIMSYDLVEAIKKITNRPWILQTGLSKGEQIRISGSVFDVLWPPLTIENKTLAKVRGALKDFEKALEDPIMRQRYQQVQNEKRFETYLKVRRETSSNYGSSEESPGKQSGSALFGKTEKRMLPPAVIRANKSLRNAANDLSLALLEDNRFLFFGDAENFGIRQIIDELETRRRQVFHVLVTPHHGTHWDKSLLKLKANYAITSNGKELCSRFRTEFKKISQRSLATFVNGNIGIG
jgi:hypothetical protein